jgi:GH25 family lysozyme M1 (1,4-beta-N-acetylmuramidase)
MDLKLARARARLAAREKALAVALKALAAAQAAAKAARAAVSQSARTVKRLSQPKTAKGIDVSNHQGTVDFARVKKAGYTFAYLKATEGLGFVDPFYLGNVQKARAAGLKVGAYHFLQPKSGRTGADEARAFHVQLAKGKLELRPVVDVEVTGLSPAQTENYVDQFVTELRQLGHDPLIYTFPAFLKWHRTHGCPLWIAHFGVSKPTVPSPWRAYTIWQHSSTARVPGVSGNCDVNRCPDLRRILA